MHLSDSRSWHGFSSSNHSHTSLHPLCAGSKPRTCSLSNTSLSTSSRSAHLQRLLAWQSARLRPNTRPQDDSAGRVRHIFCASKDQKDIYYQFEDEPEAAPEQDSPAEATNPAPAPAAAVNATPPATASPATSIEDIPICAVYRRFKTRSWVTFRASFHPPLTRVRSFR